MPIDEYVPHENETDPLITPIFNVSSNMMVTDRREAHAINQLYNHIKAIIFLADSEFLLIGNDRLPHNHPQIKPLISKFQAELPKEIPDQALLDQLRKTMVKVLLEESKVMLELCAGLSWAIDHEDAIPENSIDQIESLLAQIPFIDVFHGGNEQAGIVRVHTIPLSKK